MKRCPEKGGSNGIDGGRCHGQKMQWRRNAIHTGDLTRMRMNPGEEVGELDLQSNQLSSKAGYTIA